MCMMCVVIKTDDAHAICMNGNTSYVQACLDTIWICTYTYMYKWKCGLKIHLLWFFAGKTELSENSEL